MTNVDLIAEAYRSVGFMMQSWDSAVVAGKDGAAREIGGVISLIRRLADALAAQEAEIVRLRCDAEEAQKAMSTHTPGPLRANARLIAAAPELLEALRCFLSDTRFQVGVGGNPNAVHEMIAQARAAIAKAEGQ